MGWLKDKAEKAKQLAAAAAEKAKEAGSNVADRAKDVGDKVQESGLGEKLTEGFNNATEGGKNFAGSALEKIQEVDWKKVGGRIKDLAEDAGDLTKDGISKLDDAIKSEEFQGFLESAGDKLEGAKPLGGAIKDSLGDMVKDPEAMKTMLGGALLTGGANIPYAIAQEVMKDPAVRGTFSELVGDVLPEGMENNVDALLALSNSDLAQVLKDPSMASVLQTALQKPEMQEMLKGKLSEFTSNKPEIDPSQPASNDPVITGDAPAAMGQ